MADSRREQEYDVAISTVCYLGASFAGRFRPATANPFRAPPPPKSEGQRKAESEEGWATLRAGLAWVAKHG